MFCDASGRLLNPMHESERKQYKVERSMRMFYRLRYTHHRYMATQDPTISTLNAALQRTASDGKFHTSASQQAGLDGNESAPSLDSRIAGSTAFVSSTEVDRLLKPEETDERMDDDLTELRDILQAVSSVDDLYLDVR
jgi:hypothetical protein